MGDGDRSGMHNPIASLLHDETTNKPKKTKKKSTKKSKITDDDNKSKQKEHKSKKSPTSSPIKASKPSIPPVDENTFVGSKVEYFQKLSKRDYSVDREGAGRQPRMPPRRVSFGQCSVTATSRQTRDGRDNSLTLDFGSSHSAKSARSNRFSLDFGSTHSTKSARSTRSIDGPNRGLSGLANSIKSFLTLGSIHETTRDPRARSSGRRSAFATSRAGEQNQNFRVSKNPSKMKAERIEAFFYNHGMEIAMGVLYVSINILVAAHAAYQFTELGGWQTNDDILRVTLPIARAGGRLVTLNCALLLLTACKYLWTWVRTYVAPVLPIGFPIDNIMPKYHRYVALTVIVSGCIIHTFPQMVNYATRAIKMDHDGMKIWTFGDGFATKQLLLTGTLLTIIFSTFFVTTLKCFRKTATGFRWFWFFHMGGIATAYPLLLIHGTCRGHPIFLQFALLPLVLYLFDIAMRRSKVSTAEVVNWITHEDRGQQITELVIKCPKHFSYTPGQYAELKFAPISRSEWHPFTIASAPNETDDTDVGEEKITFYIKNSGRWTEALYNYASAFDLSKAKTPTQIQIRGPHGAPAANYFEYKHIVVIGSGVGVTPLLSIWKYLVAKGRTMAFNIDTTDRDSFYSQMEEIGNFNENYDGFFNENDGEDVENLSDGDLENSEKSGVVFEDEEDDQPKSMMQLTCIFLEKIFESMTVSMCLLVLFVLGETVTFVLQMFGYGTAVISLGSALSVIAFAAHGSTVAVSTVAMGWSKYCRLFKCWLECTIIVVDIAALAFSIQGAATVEVWGTTATTAYFLFFGVVVFLHAIRIFHIFYLTLKPTSYGISADAVVDASSSKRKSISFSTRSGGGEVKQQICSIDGILINRMYSNMKFAARSLLRPVLEDGLSDLFSMEFYGTREKPREELHKSEHGLIKDMMGSEVSGLDLRSSLGKRGQNRDDYFHPGRPNWNKIFTKALAKAHQRNPKGDSVGVFFCGSPAIAKDLQCSAAMATARHQFGMKHLDGKACKCKIIVHSENF